MVKAQPEVLKRCAIPYSHARSACQEETTFKHTLLPPDLPTQARSIKEELAALLEDARQSNSPPRQKPDFKIYEDETRYSYGALLDLYRLPKSQRGPQAARFSMPRELEDQDQDAENVLAGATEDLGPHIVNARLLAMARRAELRSLPDGRSVASPLGSRMGTGLSEKALRTLRMMR